MVARSPWARSRVRQVVTPVVQGEQCVTTTVQPVTQPIRQPIYQQNYEQVTIALC